MRLSDFTEINPYEKLPKGTIAKKISMEQLEPYEKFVSGYSLEAYSGGAKFRNGDTIMARITPCLENGKTAFVSTLDKNEVGFGSTEYIVFRAKDGISHPDFVYYLVISSLVREPAIKSMVGSSGRQRVQQTVIDELEVPNYSLAEQQHIVDILGSIDEKIESNNKIIDKNNAIMRLLFSNFYEKMKLSSETVPIGSLELTVSDFVANGSFASLKENVEILDNLSYAYFIRNTDLKAGAFNKFVSEDAYRFLAKSALYGHEVLISNVGDVGSVFLCPKLNKPMTLGNNMIFINSKGKDCYNYYLFFLFSSEEGQYLIRGITGGSAQPKFNKTDFRNIMVYNPSEKLLADFNKNVEVYLNRNTLCHSENLNLNRLKQLYLKKFFG